MAPPSDCPFTLVSGHVKVDEVVIRPRRILVDTTAGDSGDLSCVLMPERRVLTSGSNEGVTGVTGVTGHASGKKPGSGSSWWKIWG
ncbi:hypothetical protein [Schlesneria paludicola]|uniref:hypothetical protein n=1 Tax=Schlesneria paludicola TaxID=360056 RepID=UPI000299D87C|nr:hypothetical protein [Schlesneria paludicola]